MGRYISCKIGDEYEVVWKYEFGVQASEMYRINDELDIGEHHLIRYVDDDDEDTDPRYEYVFEGQSDGDDDRVDGDILILHQSDIAKLDTQLELLRKPDLSEEDELFIAMIEAIRDFISEHSAQDKFILEGEF
jgi:hypothetical protein